MRSTDDVSLWPWHLTLEVTAIVGHTRLDTLWEYQVQILVIVRLFVFHLWAIRPARLRLITWPCDLDLWPLRSWRLRLMRVIVLHPYTTFEVRRPCHSDDMAHNVSLMGLVTLTFDCLTLKLVCESHLRCGTFLPNLGKLGLWVLELFAMCTTDGRTDRQTDKSNSYCPFLAGGE